MKIIHLALWVRDLDRMRSFYEEHFGAMSGKKYHNPDKSFTSYFLTFPGSEVRLELMHKPEISARHPTDSIGLAHFAISVGSKERVNELTARLSNSGIRIIGQPRTTGDGYYESVFLDPEGNQVELTT